MFTEAIFHNTFIPKYERERVYEKVCLLQEYLANNNIVGCTLVHNDEILHLYQGTTADLKELKKYMNENFNEFHVNNISFENIEQVEFSKWTLTCEGCDMAAINFPENVLNIELFQNNYIEDRRHAFSPFAHIASAILERAPMTFQQVS